MSIKTAMKEYLDIKPLITLVVTVVVFAASFGYFSRDYVEEFKEDFKAEISEENRAYLRQFKEEFKDELMGEIKSYLGELEDDQKLPAYITVQFDLLKQLEKLISDPSDVKFTDVEKFLYYCEKDTYFVNKFIPQSDRSRALQIACEKVKEEYDSRYSSVFGSGVNVN